MRGRIPGLLGRLSLALAALAAAPALAQTDAGDPYRATVPAPDESNASRDAGLRKALEQVLARVSGSAGGFGPVLPRATSLVQHYQFERDGSGASVLTARFDPRGVQSALREHGLPVFGSHAAPAEDVILSIDGVRTAADYGRALEYLRELPGVSAVFVEEVAAPTLRLRVRVEGGEPRLASAAAAGGVLSAGAGGHYTLVAGAP